MKTSTIIALLVIASISACKSTHSLTTSKNDSLQRGNLVKAGDVLSAKELERLAEKTDFTSEQLKVAINALGYRCTYHEFTGSRIKRRLCSTQQQRDIRTEAAKRFMINSDSKVNIKRGAAPNL